MPTPVFRFALAVAVVLTTVALGGVGTGVAVAEPDEPGNTSEPSAGTEPGNVEEPSSTPTPTATSTPRNLPEQLRDFLQRPLSIFGNGRVPGEPPSTTVGTTEPEASATATVTSSDRPSDPVDAVAPRRVEVPEVRVPTVAPPVAPKVPSGASAEVRLPFTPAFTVPVLPMPGAENMRWTIDLTDPFKAYTTIEQTFATFNSLIADAYAPYDPTPAPAPGPQMRTFTEGPVLDVDGTGGGDAITLVAAGGAGGDLPVLQAPPVVVPRPLPPSAPSRTVRGVSPVPEVIAGGSAGVSAPALRGSITQTGTATAAEPLPAGVTATSPLGTPAVRQGYAQSLRVARMGEIAIVAVPGVAGLLALTFSGGVIGYRQANSGRYLREDAVRFVR